MCHSSSNKVRSHLGVKVWVLALVAWLEGLEAEEPKAVDLAVPLVERPHWNVGMRAASLVSH